MGGGGRGSWVPYILHVQQLWGNGTNIEYECNQTDSYNLIKGILPTVFSRKNDMMRSKS